ncbi:hypothetical protein ZTR_01028 [Talaromyces verruculosus]|nr:hypothetical protein ZTR_01028 [Talaromyces verruculosus]
MQSILRMPRSTTAVKPLCPYFLGGRVSIASQTLPYPSANKRYSHQSYGGNDKPQGNRPASRKSRELEHPGPPPPDVSKDSPSRTEKPKSTQKKQQEDQDRDREQTKHEELYHKKEPSNKARPTLSTGRESPNVDESGHVREDVPEDVKRHNRDLDQRYDKAYNQIGDEGKVNKGFWKGNGRSLTEGQGGTRAQQ